MNLHYEYLEKSRMFQARHTEYILQIREPTALYRCVPRDVNRSDDFEWILLRETKTATVLRQIELHSGYRSSFEAARQMIERKLAQLLPAGVLTNA